MTKRLYHGSFLDFKNFEPFSRKKMKNFLIQKEKDKLLKNFNLTIKDIENQYQQKVLKNLMKSFRFVEWESSKNDFILNHPLGIYHKIKEIESISEKVSNGIFFTDNIEYAKKYGNIVYVVDIEFETFKDIKDLHHETILLNKGLNIDCFIGNDLGTKIKTWCVFKPDKIIIIKKMVY